MRFQILLVPLILIGLSCSRTPAESPVPDVQSPRRLGQGVTAQTSDGTQAAQEGAAGAPGSLEGAEATGSGQTVGPQTDGGNGATGGTDASAGNSAVQPGAPADKPIAGAAGTGSASVPPGLPPAAAPHPRSPEVDRLLGLAQKATAEVSAPDGRCRLELGIARIESRYSPAVAAGKITAYGGSCPDMEAVRGSVLALAGQDTAAALRAIRGFPQDRRETLIVAIAENQAILDVAGAVAIVQTIESRIVREEQLIALLPALYRRDPGSIESALDRIVEPLLNDFAMARVRAVAAAQGAPPEAKSVEKGIESRLVKRWALLDVALQLAGRLPEAALALAEGLALPLDRDEVYAASSGALAAATPDKALALVMRIGDAHYRAVAAETVATAVFSSRPAMALHLVQNNLPPSRVRPAVLALFGALCRDDPTRFPEALSEAGIRLLPQDEEAVLERCCRQVPRDVRRVISEKREELRERSWYKVCLICTGLDADAQASVEKLAASGASADPDAHLEAVSCLTRQLAATSVEDALQVIEALDDPYSRDRIRLALFDDLIASRNLDRASQIAALLQDRYMAEKAAIVLVAAEASPAATSLDALEGKLLSLADTWRRDDLLAQAVRQGLRFPVGFRVRLAASVVDPALRQSLFVELAAGIAQGDLQAAVELVPESSAASARADWYLALCGRVGETAGEGR